MAGPRMVHLLTVHSAFHARVIAARLSADGVTAQLRGAVDGPYPFGDVLLYVSEDDLPTAREALLADEVDAAFDPDAAQARPERTSPLLAWVAASLAVLLLAGALLLTRLV